jgi:GNAT superfamily N-acetyltransferase
MRTAHPATEADVEFVVVGPDLEKLLTDIFSNIDQTFFRPHPFTPEEARRIANLVGRDIYALLVAGGIAVAYGMLRGWDQGFPTPYLGIAVRTNAQGRGLGRIMMGHLHDVARQRGAAEVRLRVHADNERAKRLYESLGYAYRGVERGELLMTMDLGRTRSSPRGTASRRSRGMPSDVHLVRVGDPAWDKWLSNVPHDVYHTAGYHAYSQDSGEGEAYLAVVGDQQKGLAWPYLLQRVSDVSELSDSDATDVDSVYGYPGPLAWGCSPGDPFLERAWSEIVAIWRHQNAVSAFTRFHPLLGNAAVVPTLPAPRAAGDRSGGVVAIGPTISVDLTLGEEVIRSRYGHGLRNDISAGYRAGLTTVHDIDFERLSTFTLLYHQTMVRAGATDYYFFAESDFRRLQDALSGKLHLLVTCAGEEVAAAGLFTELDGIVEWHLVGSSEAFSRLSPSKVLVNDAIHWARSRGNHVLHMGGGRGGRDDTLLWFKSRFSPERHPFHTGRWILDQRAYDELVRVRRAVIESSQTLDPSFFPAYRAPVIQADMATVASLHTQHGALTATLAPERNPV